MSRGSIAVCLVLCAVAFVAVDAKRPFTCLFFPGEGLDWPKLDVDMKDRANSTDFVKEHFDDYWGKDLVTHVTKGQACEKVYFYDTDTAYRGWREKSVALEFNNVIKAKKPHAIFAHSMANLVLSACIKRKLPYCSKIGDKIMWYGIQAPLRGTDVAKVMKRLCPTLLADKHFGGGVDCATKNDTKTGKPVVPAEYTIAESWNSMRESEVPAWVAAIASEKMQGSMCGVFATDYSKPAAEADKTAFGAIAKAMGAMKRQKELLHKDWQARNTANSRVPQFGNDGVVPFSSCKLNGNKKYAKEATSKFYVLDGSHDYGTCSEGQHDGSKNQEPCSWMANMVQNARKKLGFDGKTPAPNTHTPAPAAAHQTVSPRFAEEAEEEEEEADEEEEEETEDEESEEEEESDEAEDESEEEEEGESEETEAESEEAEEEEGEAEEESAEEDQ